MNLPSDALRKFPSTTPEQEDDFFDEDEGLLSAEEKKIVYASVGALLLPLIAGLGLAPFDLVHFMLGTKPMEFSVDPIIYLGFFFIAIHMLLVVPLAFFGYPQIRNFPSRILRVTTLFALVGAPLLSYSYYRAGKLAYLGVGEIFLAVLPAAWLASILFERTENRGLFTAILAVGTYLPLFFINDLMGPYSTYFTYASSWAGFYAVRYVGAAFSMVLASRLLRRG